MTNLNDLGRQYELSHLEESDLNPNPFEQCKIWIEEAIDAKVKDPNAMALATADRSGHVTCRMMLLKYFDENGFVFFTNYESPKGLALELHPHASMLFWWPDFERQLRIEGRVEKLDAKHSDDYFKLRETESNISAVLSKQSQVLDDKQKLIDEFEQARNAHAQLNRPEHWGGYVLKPNRFEFWQGGPHRLHDRLVYEGSANNWKILRLYP